jgi:hypothetical protein
MGPNSMYFSYSPNSGTRSCDLETSARACMIIALSGIAGISRIINFFWLFGVLTIGANQNFFDERESPLLTSLYLYLWGRGYKKIH